MKDFNLPALEIKTYYTITVNGYYLKDSLTIVDYCDIPNYLTKHIDDIPHYLLFEDYDRAYKTMCQMFVNHYLVRKNDELEIKQVNIIERGEISG